MTEHQPVAATNLPLLTVSGGWEALLQPDQRAALEAILPAYIRQQRWFGAKARQIESAQIVDLVALAGAYLTMVQLSYADGGNDTYGLPVTFAPTADAEALLRDLPRAVIARVQTDDGAGVLFDAAFDPSFCAVLLDLIGQQQDVAGDVGTLQAIPTEAFGRLRGQPDEVLKPKVGTAEQSNTSIIYGGRLIMKLFRKIETGINPDLEIGRFLTDRSAFEHVPPAAGTIEYRGSAGEPASLAFLQGFVANQGDAWSFTLRAIVGSFKHVLDNQLPAPNDASQHETLFDLAAEEPPQQAHDVIGNYLESAALLGRRTGELHLALAADSRDPDFGPEPFNESARQTTLTSMRSRAEAAFQLLQRRFATIPEAVQSSGQQILDAQDQLLERLRTTLGQSFDATRTRVHGDYHLGQILATDDDFYIIDFEGEPARPLRERRVKSSPFQDVAGMLRSFHYAPYAALQGQAQDATFDDDEVRTLDPWARYWYRWVSATFLKSYLATVGAASFIPQDRQQLHDLLNVYLLDKALYELAYELNNRPTWVRIPVEGILQQL